MKNSPEEVRTGIVLGNASLSASVSPQGGLFQRIVWNPPCFEDGKNGLQEAGRSAFIFTVDGISIFDSELEWQITEKDYPRYCARTTLPGGTSLEVCSFAPIAVGDPEPIFLPAILTTLRFMGGSRPQHITAQFVWDTDLASGENLTGSPLRQEGGTAWIESGARFAAFAGGQTPEAAVFPMQLRVSIHMEPGSVQDLRHWFGCFPTEHRWRIHADTTTALNLEIARSFSRFESQTEEWICSLPRIGNPVIDRYLRWYSQAAVLLTKSDITGRVITMGYCELNQRDSFWTSYVHLSFWPTLEQAMLRESCLWQRQDGKIPTTILPKYERKTDIDINEYFCLRIARYFDYYRDWHFLRECWPHFTKAVDFLFLLDRDGDGVPEQAPPDDPMCFWADWKDVRGITGRKLAPHFALLWLAVLQTGIKLAHFLKDRQIESRYHQAYQQAAETINRPVEDGGLWSGDHYTEQWYDGRNVPQVLQDQTVGLAFGVVSRERAASIYRALACGETAAGIPETYPFREEMEYPPGDYHNGGIWPYLTFCDCLGRYRYGNWQDAERLIQNIGKYDLELPGDWAPNEYLNGITLKNCGFEIQGWSAALFGAVTHGAFAMHWESDTVLQIQINFPERDFSTRLILPAPLGKIMIGRKDGVLFSSVPDNSPVRLILVEADSESPHSLSHLNQGGS